MNRIMQFLAPLAAGEDAPIRFIANSITREKLCMVMQKSAREVSFGPEGNKFTFTHSSVTAYISETVGFLNKNDCGMSDWLLDWYDCQDIWKHETKTSGETCVTGVWFNLLGCTTPMHLHTRLPHDFVDGGLASRTIFVYETTKGKPCPFKDETQEDVTLAAALHHDFAEVNKLYGIIGYTPKFRHLFASFYAAEFLNPQYTDNDRIETVMSRRTTHVLKLAIISAASRCHITPEGYLILGGYDFRRGLHWLTMFESNVPALFTALGGPRVSVLMRQIARWLLDSPGEDGVYLDQIQIKAAMELSFTPEDIETAVQHMIISGMVRKMASSVTGKTYLVPNRERCIDVRAKSYYNTYTPLLKD